MRLLLVRHGESICGVNGVVGGVRGCTGLTERGFEQARALRDRLASESFTADVLLASSLPRARQTAEVVGEALGLDPSIDDELVEMIPGDADGTTWDEWRTQHGFDVLNDFDRPLSPNGESVNVFHDRVCRLLDRLASEHEGRTVVACCHGGVISGSVFALTGADRKAAWMEVDFTSITEWTKNDAEPWHLVRMNDHAHLVSAGLLVP